MRLVPVDAVTRVGDTIRIDKDRDHVAQTPVYDPELVEGPSYYEDLYRYCSYPP